MKSIVKGIVGRVVAVAAAGIAALGFGVADAQAHTPKCTVIQSAGIFSGSNLYGPYVGYTYIVGGCPSPGTVDKIRLNTDNCGSLITQYQSEVANTACRNNIEWSLPKHESYAIEDTWHQPCANGLTQYIREGHIEWQEHWTDTPQHTGPIWTESFIYYFPSTFQTIFACGF